MTTYFYPNSKIASGNNNAGSMVAWESLAPSDGTRLFAPIVYGGLMTGKEMTRLNGLAYFEGFQVMFGTFGALTQSQLFLIQTNYCGGGFSGLVTVEFRMSDPTNYVTKNAVLRLTQPHENQKLGQGWKDYKFRYTKLADPT